MSETDPIRDIRRAAKKRGRADEMKREATRELRNYCLLAQAEGISISRIAREAGLSRQGVYGLMGDRQPS